MKVGGGAPEFHQGWRVEFVSRAVEPTAGADIILAEVGKQIWWMAHSAAGPGEYLFPAPRLLWQPAMLQIRTWHRLKRLQILIYRARHFLRLLRKEDLPDAGPDREQSRNDRETVRPRFQVVAPELLPDSLALMLGNWCEQSHHLNRL
jgi:hypothetical protein